MLDMSFFFLMIRPPPKSPLFPYTPLSRSPDVPAYRRDALRAGHEITGPAVVDQLDSTSLILPGQAAEVDRHGNLIIRQDRKSTRLNSSHSQISYAVFCLKKKKISRSASVE